MLKEQRCQLQNQLPRKQKIYLIWKQNINGSSVQKTSLRRGNIQEQRLSVCKVDAKFTFKEHEEPCTDRSTAMQSKNEQNQIQVDTEAADLQGKVRLKGKGKK